jgi:hypothetical protein
LADAFISALSLAAWTVGQIVPASGMGYNYLIGSGRQDHAVDHCDRVGLAGSRKALSTRRCKFSCWSWQLVDRLS